jgi:hypothetical protein
MYVCHQCGKDNSMKDGGWLSKFDVPEAQNGIEGTMAGLTDQGFDYNGAWGGTMQMGGSIPGSVGFTYARTQDPAPSNGPYAKKTKASAQDGKKISYNQWKKQNNLKETPDYNLKRAWELGYTPDKTGHLPTVDNQTGKFLKVKGHPTLNLELDWYNSPEGAEFKSKNTLDSTGKFFKYVPKLQNGQEMKFYQEGLDWKPKNISQWGGDYALDANQASQTLSNVGEVFSAPQKTIVKGITGKYQTPSEAMDIKNPYGAFAVDAVLDPLNLLGVGIAGKAAKASTKSGILSEAYKLNPYAFKPNESNWYRQVGDSAIDDAFNTGLIREAGEEVSPRMLQEFEEQLVRMQGHDMEAALASRRPTSPFFAKGELFYPMGRKPSINKVTGKVSKNPAGKGSADYLIETNLPNESFQPAYVKGMGVGVPTEIGQTAILKPNPSLRDLKNFNIYKQHWLKGYKQISKKENGGWLDKYKEGGIIEDDRGQWEYPGEITKINSNQITMQGVDYPVLGISDTGDTQMMQPGQDYTYEGESVTEIPMMKDGGNKTKAKPDSLLNLRDFTITPDELTYLNDPRNGYCVNTGNCLESTRKAYDMTAGRIKGIPDSNSILTKDLGLTSTRTKPTEKQIQEYPYFAGDKNYGSSDSWDEQGVIIKAGGKNIFSGAKNQMVPKDIPVGAIAGWGPSGTRETTYADRKQGMNTKYGLQPSHHSTESMGYNDNGEAIFYDSFLRKYGTIEDIGKELKNELGYELENIGVPKSVSGNTREGLSKKGLLKNELTPYTANVDTLVSATNQPWAQINEDGKMRSPKVDKEKLTKFAQALIDNKGELISNLGLSNSEYDRLANTALAISMVESEGGGALGYIDRFGSTQGMTQLNLDNITKDARLSSSLKKKYKKDANVKDLGNAYNSAIATMMYLSVADKDAQRLFNKGLKPGEKTFNQPGFIENFRSSSSKLNKEGVFIDELNKRIPYSEIPGYSSGDTTKVNNYLKKITKTDRYSFVNKDGDLSLKLKTKGNNPELTDIEKIGYMWQSPSSLKTGDAEGKSEYVNKIKNYYDSLSKKENGGWLSKYN